MLEVIITVRFQGCLGETAARSHHRNHWMKFGKTLLRAQKPEWANNYIAYKNLKQLIKAIHETSAAAAASDENKTSFDDKIAGTNHIKSNTDECYITNSSLLLSFGPRAGARKLVFRPQKGRAGTSRPHLD